MTQKEQLLNEIEAACLIMSGRDGLLPNQVAYLRKVLMSRLLKAVPENSPGYQSKVTIEELAYELTLAVNADKYSTAPKKLDRITAALQALEL